jgi:2-haloalkanoic acid dehalogenase type II
MRRHDVITFDCYGTLIDWETGIFGAFQRVGAPVERATLLGAYAEEEVAVEAMEWRPYREVLAEVARRLGARFGFEVPDEGRFLAKSLPDWDPFPDTNEALDRLRRGGYELGLLSNTDDDLLTATRGHLPVKFDVIVTAEQVRSYKPAHGHFVRARELVGERPWIHAAQSYLHDIVPARELGIDHAWVNRAAQMPLGGGTAALEVKTLSELADAIV